MAINTEPLLSPSIVERAAGRLSGVAHRTPTLTSRTLRERTGAAEVFIKCENLQRTGSFKFRGAYNALSALLEREPGTPGVLTFSSGNHAQALALAGRILGVGVTIVMPEDAPRSKRQAAEGYGANIIPYDRAKTTRDAIAARVAGERGLPIIPPYDHEDVIAGQGTTARELFEDVGPLDDFLVCVGGGGLISGCALATHAACPNCRVIGAEPANADDATRSFHTGVLQTVHNPDTIADGARTPCLGRLTFPIVRALVAGMVTVSEGEIARAMFLLMERMKLVVEPTGALAAAGLLQGGRERFAGRRVGVLISGGNVDMAALPGLLELDRPAAEKERVPSAWQE